MMMILYSVCACNWKLYTLAQIHALPTISKRTLCTAADTPLPVCEQSACSREFSSPSLHSSLCVCHAVCVPCVCGCRGAISRADGAS